MTRSNNHGRHSLAVVALAVATTFAADIRPSEDDVSRPAKAACAEKSFSQVLEERLSRLSEECLPVRSDDVKDLVEGIRRLVYADDDRRSLIALGENDAMASFAVTLWETCGLRLYTSEQWTDETGRNEIPDLLQPSPEGIEAWRHTRKRMRKGKFGVA